MKKLALVLMLMVSLCAVCSAQGKVPYLGEEEIKSEVERSLGGILDLWRDGKYDDLYERTLVGGSSPGRALPASSPRLHSGLPAAGRSSRMYGLR